MATEQINVRIEGGTKLAAEQVLGKIGLTPSDAIRMFYSQIVMLQGLPFTPRIVAPVRNNEENMRTRIKASIDRNHETLEILANR